jgi:hypothetical protein
MTLSELARTVIEDPGYRASVVERARAGTLPLEIEMLLLEAFEMADGRLSMSAGRAGPPPVQSKTLALLRPSAPAEETQS